MTDIKPGSGAMDKAIQAVCSTPCTSGNLFDVDLIMAETIARAVLVAVLPELKRYGCDCEFAGSREEDDRGEFVLYDDLTAILAEGE